MVILLSLSLLLWWGSLPARCADAAMNTGDSAVQQSVGTTVHTDQNPYRYVGNRYSLKFHRPSCPFARRMWSERMQLFHFRKDAIGEGLQPCRYCLPPVWTQVHAVVLDRWPAQPASADRALLVQSAIQPVPMEPGAQTDSKRNSASAADRVSPPPH